MADTDTGDRAPIADPATSQAAAPQQVRSVLVLGADGPSGRRTVQQALERGPGVGALTRRPETFPITHGRLRVIGGDATDPATVDAAVAPYDAVVSVIGTAFTRHPVEVCSASARLVVAAAARADR